MKSTIPDCATSIEDSTMLLKIENLFSLPVYNLMETSYVK